jgi:hypothetical protein
MPGREAGKNRRQSKHKAGLHDAKNKAVSIILGLKWKYSQKGDNIANALEVLSPADIS